MSNYVPIHKEGESVKINDKEIKIIGVYKQRNTGVSVYAFDNGDTANAELVDKQNSRIKGGRSRHIRKSKKNNSTKRRRKSNRSRR